MLIGGIKVKNDFRILGDKVEIDIYCKGKKMVTFIDLVDLERVSSFEGNWYGFVDNRSGKIYVKLNQKEKNILLHRVIIGLENVKGYVVDHLNHKTTDNTRTNLRATTFVRNAKRKLEEVAQVKKAGKKWGVYVRGILVGQYLSKEEAQVMSIVANMEHFPELESFHCWDTVLWKLGYDIATAPIKRKENGELDFSQVTPDKIRKVEKKKGVLL
jgi:hypothetical protein